MRMIDFSPAAIIFQMNILENCQIEDQKIKEYKKWVAEKCALYVKKFISGLKNLHGIGCEQNLIVAAQHFEDAIKQTNDINLKIKICENQIRAYYYILLSSPEKNVDTIFRIIIGKYNDMLALLNSSKSYRVFNEEITYDLICKMSDEDKKVLLMDIIAKNPLFFCIENAAEWRKVIHRHIQGNRRLEFFANQLFFKLLHDEGSKQIYANPL